MRFRRRLAADVGLAEERHDFIAGLEAVHLSADRDDFAGSVGAGDDIVRDAKWVFALRDDEIAVLVLITISVLL